MRPVYHYAPAANWLSDPNGLVHVAGEWHLFYQYNPHHDQWGHMAWGHAVSRDLAHWDELQPALLEDDRHLIFSGSAVVDTDGAGGFGAGALVAIYTGAARDASHQVQCLAASDDGGRHWRKFAGNPVLDRGSADFRDPNVFWHVPSARWIMVVALSAENRCLVFGSGDLREWTELSSIGPLNCPGQVWECPLLIELPIEGGGTRWLFKVDVLHGGPGSGAVALTGAFDGRDFVPDRSPGGGIDWQLVDGGRDFYAAIAWPAPRDAAGRPCWIGWMGNHGYQAALPSRGWRGAMSLPRRIGLRTVGSVLKLVQEVEPAIGGLLDSPDRLTGSLAEWIIPTASRIEIDRVAGSALTVRFEQFDRRLTINIAGDRLRLTRDAGIAPGFDAPIDADIAMAGALVVWLDHASIEIETGDGTCWVSAQHDLTGRNVALSIEGRASATVTVSAVAAAGLRQTA